MHLTPAQVAVSTEYIPMTSSDTLVLLCIQVMPCFYVYYSQWNFMWVYFCASHRYVPAHITVAV